MKTTLVVLELEGPPSVVAAANLVRRTCNDYLDLIEGDLPASHSWNTLERAAEQERVSLSPDAATPVHDARTALSTLASLMDGVRAAGGRFVPWGPDPNTDPEAVFGQIERAHTTATDALDMCPAIPESQARVLLHDAALGGRFEMVRQVEDYLGSLDQARTAFLDIAREQLDTAQ
ncbi:hypothetical protein ACFVH0_36800 [Streptomyces sp. NPDC127117]|uniref:hypothetical protein n=1 Tax=Streptomyces sp. NPDC127117 TaxID=3345368 RepID=UPI00364216DC